MITSPMAKPLSASTFAHRAVDPLLAGGYGHDSRVGRVDQCGGHQRGNPAAVRGRGTEHTQAQGGVTGGGHPGQPGHPRRGGRVDAEQPDRCDRKRQECRSEGHPADAQQDGQAVRSLRPTPLRCNLSRGWPVYIYRKGAPLHGCWQGQGALS